MKLFRKKRTIPKIEEVQKELVDIKYIPYICDGEKWLRMYDEDELELVKKEAYEQGFKDGVASKEQKIILPSGKFLPKAVREGDVFLYEV